MKKASHILLVCLITLSLTSACGKKYECPMGDPDIVGARCIDGTTSDAAGSGACSSHGGVDYWLCCCE